MAKIKVQVRTEVIPEKVTPAVISHHGSTFYVEKRSNGGWLFGDAGTITESRRAQELIELLKLVRDDLVENGA